jgi:hypothetical protein
MKNHLGNEAQERVIFMIRSIMKREKKPIYQSWIGAAQNSYSL